MPQDSLPIERPSREALAALAAQLRALLGPEHVIDDAAERAMYAMDVLEAVEPVDLAIRPGATEDLAKAVALCTAAGFAVIPRGSGLSYTRSYLPARAGSVTVDMTRMNRIIEVQAEDMYVTVECGATWKQVYDAVSAKGLRTPYWGALSGLESTVGGALSQNSVFLGSGKWGTAAEQVLSLDVVLADGTVLTTGGSAGMTGGTPFMKHYGPDLSGPFLADAGALGIKARATLRLIALPEARRYASFTYDNATDLIGAMSKIGREGLAAECFAFDPYMQTSRISAGGNLKEDAITAIKVLKAQGLRDTARMVFAGRRWAEETLYGLHVAVEERFEQTADEAIKRVRALALEAGGRETENAVPMAMNARPFVPPDSMLGIRGERWVPIHGVVPHSRARSCLEAIERLFADEMPMIEAHDIKFGFLVCNVAQQGFLIEPVLYWPDARLPFHERRVRAGHLAKLPVYPKNPAATEAATALRDKLRTVFEAHGAVHFQIGKYYRYRETRAETPFQFLQAIKALVDPNGRVNPGALGLD